MYGTVAKLTLKPGAEDGLRQLTDTEMQDYSPPGYLYHAVYKLDSGNDEYILAVGFADKESYFANANSPEQNDFYIKFRELLAADPVWMDGEIIASKLP